MTQLELFAGIGGFGLAGHWAGIETVCQVEIDPFCQKVLQKNFPNAHRHTDIKTFDGTQWRGTDIVSGGFPCQPFSSAGKRSGTDDERYLWPEMLRVIAEVQPHWVVGENVFGIVNWSGGMVFEQVHTDLESIGYETAAFVIPACGQNAPHKRDRVWFVAHSIKGRSQSVCSGFEQNTPSHQKPSDNFGRYSAISTQVFERDSGDLRRGDGLSNRMDRIGALGNAIVPQIAYQIFKAIKAYSNQ